MRGQKIELPIEEIPEYDSLLPAGNMRSRRMSSKEPESPQFPKEEDSFSHNSSQHLDYKLPKSNYFQRNLAKRKTKRKESNQNSETSSQKTPKSHSSRSHQTSSEKSKRSSLSAFQTPQSSNNSSPAPQTNEDQIVQEIQSPVTNSIDELPKTTDELQTEENEIPSRVIPNSPSTSSIPESILQPNDENTQPQFIEEKQQEEINNNTSTQPIELMKPMGFPPKQIHRPIGKPAAPPKPNSPSPSVPLNVQKQKPPPELNKLFTFPTTAQIPKQSKKMIPTIPKKEPFSQNSDSMKRFEMANANINLTNPRLSNRVNGRLAQGPFSNPLLKNESANDLLVPPAEENSSQSYFKQTIPSAVSIKQKYIPQIPVSQSAIDRFFAASAYSISENFAPRKANLGSIKENVNKISLHSADSQSSLRELSQQTTSLEETLSVHHDQFTNITHSVTELSQKTSMAKDRSDVLLDKMETIGDTVGMTTITLQYVLRFVAIIYWIIMLIVGIFMAPFKKREKMSLNDAQNKLNKRLSHMQADSEAETETSED